MIHSLAKAMGAIALAAVAFSSSFASAASCRLFRDAHFGGGYFDIPANTRVADFTKVSFWNWVQKCEPITPARTNRSDGFLKCSQARTMRIAHPGFSKCTDIWSAVGGADNGVSSVQVPANCSLRLFEHPGYTGAVATYMPGDHGETYAGIPNDSASSAFCQCGGTVGRPAGEIVVFPGQR